MKKFILILILLIFVAYTVPSISFAVSTDPKEESSTDKLDSAINTLNQVKKLSEDYTETKENVLGKVDEAKKFIDDKAPGLRSVLRKYYEKIEIWRTDKAKLLETKTSEFDSVKDKTTGSEIKHLAMALVAFTFGYKIAFYIAALLLIFFTLRIIFRKVLRRNE